MENKIGRITGTFLDEITADIASQNWTAEDWALSFEAMAYIGIDTVIIIRGGFVDQAVFPSKVVGNFDDQDLAQVFLDNAAKHNMKLFFGTFDKGYYLTGQPINAEVETDLNIKFLDEVMARYGGHPALGGWYLTHEVCSNAEGANTLYKNVAGYLKKITPSMPILISPYYPSKFLVGENSLTPDEFLVSWRELLAGLSGLVDIMAFQDSTCKKDEYISYLTQVKKLSEETGIQVWNNFESFDREKSFNFPPKDIRTLMERLSMAEPYVSKHITFEFSHFMSPNSCFPGALNLYRRYCERVLGKKSPY
ncbi:MAG TPA: DUF4434 domain-containing protein [Armatimonadota bacterium]|jgi:hypothetical protein